MFNKQINVENIYHYYMAQDKTILLQCRERHGERVREQEKNLKHNHSCHKTCVTTALIRVQPTVYNHAQIYMQQE